MAKKRKKGIFDGAIISLNEFTTSRVSATSTLRPPKDNKYARIHIELANLTQRAIKMREINRKALVNYEMGREKEARW